MYSIILNLLFDVYIYVKIIKFKLEYMKLVL